MRSSSKLTLHVLIFFDILRTMYPATYLRALPSLLDNDSAAVGSIVVAMLYCRWMSSHSTMSVRLCGSESVKSLLILASEG